MGSAGSRRWHRRCVALRERCAVYWVANGDGTDAQVTTPKGSQRPRSKTAAQPPPGDDEWLTLAAQSASRDAGGVPVELLGDYLPMLAAAATFGRFPGRAQIDAVRQQGRRAAEAGVSVGRGVDLYLSAARHVWGDLPAVVRERDNKAVRAAAEAVLHVVDDAVAAFAEGHAEAGHQMIRREETLRRELIEDLLRGGANLAELVERAEPFGLDLTRAHQVALAQPGRRLSRGGRLTALERVVLNRFGDRDVLVATKEGLVVVVALADATGVHRAPSAGGDRRPGQDRARRAQPATPRVALAGGRGPGPPRRLRNARSYEEAREG